LFGSHHDDPDEDTPLLEGETEPSLRGWALTSTIELGDTDEVRRSPKKEHKILLKQTVSLYKYEHKYMNRRFFAGVKM